MFEKVNSASLSKTGWAIAQSGPQKLNHINMMNYILIRNWLMLSEHNWPVIRLADQAIILNPSQPNGVSLQMSANWPA